MVFHNILKENSINLLNNLAPIRSLFIFIKNKVMYYIIEGNEQLEQFQRHNYKEVFMEIIPFSNNIHPSQNEISLIYVRPREETKGFMLCIQHSETLSIALNLALKSLKTYSKIYVRDKKETLHYLSLKSLWDINPGPKPVQLSTTVAHEVFYRKYGDLPDINRLIPISKHYEVCEQLYEDLKHNIKEEHTEYEQFFNSKVAVVFNAIERSGLRVQPELFGEYFHDIDGEYVFTNFNLKTTTTRPANSYGGVNYAALNKDNGCRASFIPRNDLLVEMDISAFHPCLLAGLIGYQFEGDIHSQLADLYGVSYEEGKQITFRQLYGGVYKQYKHIEFFSKVEEYVQELWQKFNEQGYIECPISHYMFRKSELVDMNPQKLLNYKIQCVETSLNVLILFKIFRILVEKKTKLIHYCFDSFVFDHSEDEEDVIEQIKQIFVEYNLNIKIKQGINYDFKN